jgi:hypothetical protein
MKTNPFDKLTLPELGIFTFFVLYIVFPTNMPKMAIDFIHSPISLTAIFILAIYLFYNSNPILAVLYIFFAYEILRRSNHITYDETVSYVVDKRLPGIKNQAIILNDEKVIHRPNQTEMNFEMAAMNPKQQESLEESMVDKMAPVGVSEKHNYVTTSFHPIIENLRGITPF